MKGALATTGRVVGLLGAGSGAVIERELRAQGRRWGTYLSRAAAAAVLLAVFSLMAYAIHDDASRQSGAQRIQTLQQFAPVLSIGVLWIQFVLVALLGPVLTGPSVCDERRTGTLATLLTTPLKAAHIVLGKLFGALVQLFIIAVIPAPLLLVVRIFGGLDVETVIAGFALTMSMGLLCASLGLYFSTRLRRGAAAAAAGLIAAATLHGLPTIVMALLLASRTYNIPLNTILSFSAPAVLAMVSANVFGALPPGLTSLQYCWMFASCYSLVLSTIVILWTILTLRRMMVTFEEKATQAPPLKRSRTKKTSIPAPGVPAAEPAPIAVRPSRTVSDHPVFWRELRLPFFSSWRKLAVALVAIVALFGWAYHFGPSMGYTFIHQVTVGIGSFFMLVIAAVLPAGLIAAEREARTLDSLFSSRLSSWEIIWGKALGSLRRQLFIPFIVLAELCFGVIVFSNVRAIMLLHFVMIAAPTIFFLACTGVLAGTLLRRSVHAMVANAALAISLWFVFPIAVQIFWNFTSRSGVTSSDPLISNFLEFINPVVLLGQAGQGALNGSLAGRGNRMYYLFSSPIDAPGFTLYLVAYAAMYLVAGLAALRIASGALRSRFAGA